MQEKNQNPFNPVKEEIEYKRWDRNQYRLELEAELAAGVKPTAEQARAQILMEEQAADHFQRRFPAQYAVALKAAQENEERLVQAEAAKLTERQLAKRREALLSQPYAGDRRLIDDYCERMPVEQYRRFSKSELRDMGMIALAKAQDFLTSGGIAPLTDEEAVLISKWAIANSLNIGDSEGQTLITGFQILKREGLIRIPEPVKLFAAPVVPEPVKVEPKNPYPYDNSAQSEHSRWARRQAETEAAEEIAPAFREGVQTLCVATPSFPDGREMSSQNMRVLFNRISAHRLALTTSNIRKTAFSIWPEEMRDVMTPGEMEEFDREQADSLLSSEEIRRKYRLGMGRY